MSNAAVPMYRIYELPWSTGFEDDDQFKKLARGSLVAALVIALVFWVLPEPQIDPATVDEVPKRLVRLVLEREAPPPPPAPVVREERPEPEPVVEERRRRVEPEPEPVGAGASSSPNPSWSRRPQRPHRAGTRARARAGLLPLASNCKRCATPSRTIGLDRADIGCSGQRCSFAERALVTSRVGTASGGINTAALSRNTGGSGLGGRETTQVENPVEGFVEAGGAAQRSGDSNKAPRSREEIERVFDANKGRIFTLYNRALRENPALQGKVVLRLTIAPGWPRNVLRDRLVGARRRRARARPRAARAAVHSSRLATTSSPSRPRSRSTSSGLTSPLVWRSGPRV